MARDTATETATAVQEKMFEAIKAGHKATLDAAHDWAEAVATIMPKIPELAEPFMAAIPSIPEWSLPTMGDLIGFSEKVWESQRDFNMKRYEVVAPVGRTVFGAAKSTAAKAERAASESVKTSEPPHTTRAAAKA